MTGNKKWINITAIIITLLICYFPLCHRINSYCIQLWDESRNVTNAIEMLHNHKWLIRYFENKPDLWELKPPFLVWCQALSFKILGFNETAARFPSMVFSMCTVLLLIWMGYKITGKIYSGILASLILVSGMGYVDYHGARFGDHEATLTFFSTALVCFSYLFFTSKLSKYLGLAFIALFFGWFTKSISIFMFIPSLFLWTLLNKQLKEILVRKSFWVGLVGLSGLIILYYLLHERSTPGYIQQVWVNELFERYFGATKDYAYKHDPFYYVIGFMIGRFPLYFILFVAGGVMVMLMPKLPHRQFLLYLLLVFVTFFVLISLGSKNFWYDVPLYPIASLFLSILMVDLYDKITTKSYRIAYCLVFFISISICYFSVIRYVILPEKNYWDDENRLCRFLKDESPSLPKHLKVIHNGYFAPFYLYVEDAKTKNTFITLSKTLNLEVNDTFLITNQQLISKADSLFDTRIILEKGGCVMKIATGIKLPAEK